MTQPSGGFNHTGLEQLFGGPTNGSSTPESNSTTSSPVPSPSTGSHPAVPASSAAAGSHPSQFIAPIAGGVAGGIAFLGMFIAGFFYRKRLRLLVIGGQWPSEELDGENIVRNEIMGKEAIWELPAPEKPIELESPMEGWTSPDRSSAGRSSAGRSGMERSSAGHGIPGRSSNYWISKPLPKTPPLPPWDWI